MDRVEIVLLYYSIEGRRSGDAICSDMSKGYTSSALFSRKEKKNISNLNSKRDSARSHQLQ